MIVGINVTPMVDVVLVLLVIMMVSAHYIVSQSIKVKLPKAVNSDGSAASPTTVIITDKGVRMLEGAPVTDAQLTAAFEKASGADPDANLVVTADAATDHGQVMGVIDLARSAGIQNFAINVERPE